MVFAQSGALESFKESVNMVMPVIKEATVRERAMMGSKSVVGNLKRKRDAAPIATMEDKTQEYFFAKYLTSHELLELEVSFLSGYWTIVDKGRNRSRIPHSVASFSSNFLFSCHISCNSRRLRRQHGSQQETGLCKWTSPSTRTMQSGFMK